MNTTDTPDLGFTFVVRKNGNVVVLHHGRVATTLRGAKAHAFIEEVEQCDSDAAQQLMARATGNYKRGNERTAQRHPRNRH
jgi:hypothetical protein